MTSASNSGVVGDGEGEIVARLSTDEWIVVQVGKNSIKATC